MIILLKPEVYNSMSEEAIIPLIENPNKRIELIEEIVKA